MNDVLLVKIGFAWEIPVSDMHRILTQETSNAEIL